MSQSARPIVKRIEIHIKHIHNSFSLRNNNDDAANCPLRPERLWVRLCPFHPSGHIHQRRSGGEIHLFTAKLIQDIEIAQRKVFWGTVHMREVDCGVGIRDMRCEITGEIVVTFV